MNTARRALSPAAIRAIAIRRKVAARAAAPTAANDNAKRTPRTRGMSTALLAACVEAGGFEQNARFDA